MDLNQQLLSDLAEQLGLEDNAQSAVKAAVDMAEGYSNRDEATLESEIKKLKKTMKTDSRQYQKQIEVLKGLRPVLNEEQLRQLDKVLGLLGE
jgi:hypothetical protein